MDLAESQRQHLDRRRRDVALADAVRERAITERQVLKGRSVAAVKWASSAAPSALGMVGPAFWGVARRLALPQAGMDRPVRAEEALSGFVDRHGGQATRTDDAKGLILRRDPPDDPSQGGVTDAEGTL
jgi:hypothetical protein